MKVSRGFVKFFLSLFLIVIVVNISALIWDFYANYMGWTLAAFVFILFFLIFRKRDGGSLKFVGFIVILIILGLAAYFVYTNFLTVQITNYTYNIGGSEDLDNPYLIPASRTSSVISKTSGNETVDYRNLASQLIYFEIPVSPKADTILVEMKIKNQFPKKGTMLLGADISKEWNYTSNLVYNRTLFPNTADEWIIVRSSFDVKNLYIEKNKLSMLIELPYIQEDTEADYYIPIDWINATVTKDGMFDSANSFSLNVSKLYFWKSWNFNVDFSKLAFWKNKNSSNETIVNKTLANKTVVNKTLNNSAASSNFSEADNSAKSNETREFANFSSEDFE
jgi:hypothetical protein